MQSQNTCVIQAEIVELSAVPGARLPAPCLGRRCIAVYPLFGNFCVILERVLKAEL